MKKNLLLAVLLIVTSFACTDTSLTNKPQDKTAVQAQNKITLDVKDMVVLAVDTNNKESAIKLSQEVKENFVKLFALFGDFPVSK